MERRGLLSRLAFLPLFAGAGAGAEEPKKPLRIMFKSAWGSDDPTKAAFAFLHGNALAEAGHSVQIFLLGEAVSLMRSSVAHAVVPVGWPPLAEALTKASANEIQIYACGACSRARDHGGRSHPMGRQVRKSDHLRLIDRVGRPRHHGVAAD